MAVEAVGIAPHRLAFVAAGAGQGRGQCQAGILPPAFTLGDPAKNVLVEKVALGVNEVRLGGNVGADRYAETIGLCDFMERFGGRPDFGRIGDGNALQIFGKTLAPNLGNLGNKIFGHRPSLLATAIIFIRGVVAPFGFAVNQTPLSIMIGF